MSRSKKIVDRTASKRTADLVRRYREAIDQVAGGQTSPEGVFDLLKLNAIDWQIEHGLAPDTPAPAIPSKKREKAD